MKSIIRKEWQCVVQQEPVRNGYGLCLKQVGLFFSIRAETVSASDRRRGSLSLTGSPYVKV